MCVLLLTLLKRVPLCRGLCSRVAAGDGVRETLITCNEIPEITLQRGNSKHPTPTASQFTLIRLHLKKKRRLLDYSNMFERENASRY